MDSPAPSLAAMMVAHEDFAAVVLQLREAALHGRWVHARALHGWLDEALRLHIQQEEELLLPHHTALGSTPSNGSALVIAADHRRIEDRLDAVAEALERPDAVAAQAALAALEGLLDHHDQREQRWLVPALDAALSDAERSRILDAVSRAWDALPALPELAAEVSGPEALARAVQLVEALRGAAASGASHRALSHLCNDAATAQNRALARVELEHPDDPIVRATHAKLRRVWDQTASAVLCRDPLGTWDRATTLLRLLRAHPRRSG